MNTNEHTNERTDNDQHGRPGPDRPDLALPSLLDADPALTPPEPRPPRVPLRARLASVATGLWARPAFRRASAGLGAAAVIAAGISAYFVLRPTPKPDILDDALDDVLDFTLLEEDFNDLPLEERLKIMGELIARLRDMDGSDALLLAAFAEGIAGAAREQLERNITRLGIDVGDQLAAEYTSVPEPDREQFLDDAYIRLARLTEPFDSALADRTDEEILERGRREARQAQEFLREGEIPAEAAASMSVFGYNRLKTNASPKEYQRLTVFFRDMTRRLRAPDGPN